MKPIVAFVPSLAILVCGASLMGQQSPITNAPVAGSPITWSGTQQVAVPDPSYGMTAYTLNIPNGWHFGGELVRAQGCHGNSMSLNYKISSPDDLTAIIQLAGVHWHWDNDEWKDRNHMRQCEPVEISSAADFVINVLLPEVRPNAKIVSVIAPTPEQQRSLDQAGEAEMQMYVGWAKRRTAAATRLCRRSERSARICDQRSAGGRDGNCADRLQWWHLSKRLPSTLSTRHQLELHCASRAYCSCAEGTTRCIARRS